MPAFAFRWEAGVPVETRDTLEMDDKHASPSAPRHACIQRNIAYTRSTAVGLATTPSAKPAAPRRKRAGDIEPDLQFLSVPELEAVLRAIPSDIVRRQPAPTRREAPARRHPRRRTSSDQYPASSSPRP